MKEIRRIQTDRVRNMCIENNYFTKGTCEEYEEMFELCRKENPTTIDYFIIGDVILNHSNKEKLLKKPGLQLANWLRE